MDDVLGRNEFAITEVGIVFRKAIDFEVWENLGDKLLFFHHGIQWMIGDWFLFGEKCSWGEQWAQCLDAVKLDYSTLMNYRRIASIFPIGARWAALSWTHHREVADLTPELQQFWLKAASENQWSVRQMLEAMASAQIKPGTLQDSFDMNDPVAQLLKKFAKLSHSQQTVFLEKASESVGAVLTWSIS